MDEDIEDKLRKEIDKTREGTYLRTLLQAALDEIQWLRTMYLPPAGVGALGVDAGVLGEARATEAPDVADMGGEAARLVPRDAPKEKR